MKIAKKRPKYITAYELGTQSEMEIRLQNEHKIQKLDDERYLLFSIEAMKALETADASQVGQVAKKGDFFKTDQRPGGCQ